MSVHSCNRFCDKDIRFHYFQKGNTKLELGFDVDEEMLKEELYKEKQEIEELIDLLVKQ